ncbi:MAG: diguanylate cyclase [Gemmatimonadaceae bacterium]
MPSNAAHKRGAHIALVGPEMDPDQTVSTLVALGQAEARNGRHVVARNAFEDALSQLKTDEEAKQASAIIRWIARTYQVEEAWDVVLDCCEAAIAIAEAWADDSAVGHAINIQAAVRWKQGNLDEAERHFMAARTRAIKAGDAKLSAMTAQNLGVLANIRGDHGVAQHHFEASLNEYRSLGLTEDVSWALNNLGLLYSATKRWDDAERVFAEAVQISDLAGDVSTRVVLDVNRAELWVARGDFARAQASIDRALEFASRSSDASVVGKATKLLGVIAREVGDFAESERQFLRADELATARQEVLLQAEIARERADLARRMGKNRDALQQLNRAHQLFTGLRAQCDLADVVGRVGSLEHEFLHMARRWGESIEAKDHYTQGHCVRVAEMTGAIAKRAGLDERTLFWVNIGALLHDVGKLVIPSEVLNKPGKLTEEEWTLMRTHTTAGVEMLAEIEFPWDIRPIVESHHERWDGEGYPHGLKGEEIPLLARILCVADVYDALTSVRSYKAAMSHVEAMAFMHRNVGTMFDPVTFAWFEEVAESWPSRAAAAMADRVERRAGGAAPKAVLALPGEYDDLTGMPLRRAFRETAERILTARRTTERPVSLLVIDIDHFKLINDNFGHLQGDDVLRMVADQLRVNTRPSDYVARYAGDEFVVLLAGTRLEDACSIAERIRQGVATVACARRDGPGGDVKITLSIGVASAPDHGVEFEPLFAAADAALYAGKRSGRDRITPAGMPDGPGRDILLECFIGRTTERQRLRRVIDGAARGEPHVAVVIGEAGVGKSALLKQMAPEVGIRSGCLLVGRCIEAQVRAPYAVWADIVTAASRAGIAPERPWRELGRLVPRLAGSAEGANVVQNSSQHALLEELEEFLTLASVSRPLVIVLDDMQWADIATWDTLEYLMSRFTDQQVLIVLTIRAEDLSAAGEERRRRLSRSERYSEIDVPRLSREDVTQWLRTALGGQHPDMALVDYISEQSEGNALFAVQTLRALIDEGRLYATDGRWTFRSATELPVPRAIGDLLARRLDRISPERREVLTTAAILGREFDPETLVLACDGWRETAVLDALDAGLAAGILAPSERSKSELTFTHVLFTNALQDKLSSLRLQRIHGSVARALEQRGMANSAEVAVHFDRAGCAADAYRTGLEAGAQAAALYAYGSAGEFFEIAQRHARAPAEQAEVEWQLAGIEELMGRYSEAEAHCDAILSSLLTGSTLLGILPAARRMRERLRLQRGAAVAQVLEACAALLAEARLDASFEEIVPLLVMISTLHSRLGDTAAGERAARQAAEDAKLAGSLPLLADAEMRLGSTALDASPADAVRHYRNALDIFTQLDNRHGQLRCQINIGVACDRAGNHPTAEASYAKAIHIGHDIRATDLAGVASLNLGVLLLKTGNFSGARERFDEALQCFTKIGNEQYRLAALYNLANLARAQGDAAGAVELYGATVTLATSLEHAHVLAGALAGVGLAQLDLGETRGALQQHEAVSALRATRENWWFQGCELCEALSVRIAAATLSLSDAVDALLDALTRADGNDQYAGLWLAAECAAVLASGGEPTAPVKQRYVARARALGYQPLITKLQTN